MLFRSEFELNFTITSFSFVCTKGAEVQEKIVKGNKFTPEILGLIKNAGRGQRITMERIMALGPDGSRQLAPINIKLN